MQEYYFRGHSACSEKELVKWLRDEGRSDGPKGAITFGISVRMPPSLNKHIVRLGENLWKPYREDTGMISECADLLNYWPEEEERPEGAGPLRYIAIRMRKRQGELFTDGSEVKSVWPATSGGGMRRDCWNGNAKRPAPLRRCITYEERVGGGSDGRAAASAPTRRSCGWRR